MRFTDKVCLVTGAGSGIGKATALQMANEGGKVLVIDRNPEGGKAVVDQITNAKGTALLSQADVGKVEDIQRAVDMALHNWGRIDILVNNAAMMTFKKIVDLSMKNGTW